MQLYWLTAQAGAISPGGLAFNPVQVDGGPGLVVTDVKASVPKVRRDCGSSNRVHSEELNGVSVAQGPGGKRGRAALMIDQSDHVPLFPRRSVPTLMKGDTRRVI